MSCWYLDTSAATKLIAEEAESVALAHLLDSEQPDLVACWLLETELRRAVQRDEALSQEMVTDLLEGVSLYELPGSLCREAGLLPGTRLRSLDAIHLAAAIRIGVDQVVTYDARMSDSARTLGLSTLAPAPMTS
ncbi:MAG: type II toxin-antitoxin system VapC family toxin [Propionibacteriales bacterium]|nr:type II toxin-antitoxin system VapC family toxin [Propionibacteriales bacterium]